MKVGIIGCGTIANNAHIPAYMANEKAEIKYFCDINLEQAQRAVEKNGCEKAVKDYMEVINDPEVDAVSVCTPNNVHSEISIAALKAVNMFVRKTCCKYVFRSLGNAKGPARNGQGLKHWCG
jgi:predicted dehydrogenase